MEGRFIKSSHKQTRKGSTSPGLPCMQKAESLSCSSCRFQKRSPVCPAPTLSPSPACPGKGPGLALHQVRQRISDKDGRSWAPAPFLLLPCLQTELNKMKRLCALEVMETDNFINLAHVEITGEHGGPIVVKITLF